MPDTVEYGKWLLFSTNSSALIKVSDAIGKYFMLIRNGSTHNYAIKYLVTTENVDKKNLAMKIDKLVHNKKVFPKKPLFPDFKNDGLEMLWLHMSHACNAACRYCYAGQGKYFYQDHGRNMMMDDATAREAVNFLFKFACGKKELAIQFFGGEPLMNFDTIRRTVDYADALSKKYGVKLFYGITTNFYLANREMIDFFQEHGFSILVSIDGPAFVQKFLRPTKNGVDYGDSLWRNLQYTFTRFKNHEKLIIRSSITSFFPFPYQIARYFYSNTPVRNISISPVSSKGQFEFGEEDKTIYITENQKLAELYLNSLTNRDWLNILNFTSFVKQFYNATGGYKCGMGIRSVNVDPAGNIYLCQWVMGKEEFKLGNIRTIEKTTFFRQVAKNKYLHELNVTRKPICRDCWARFLCGGGCMGRAVMQNKDYLYVDPLTCWYSKLNITTAMSIMSELQLRGTLSTVINSGSAKEEKEYARAMV